MSMKTMRTVNIRKLLKETEVDESNGCQRNKIGPFDRCGLDAFCCRVWYGFVMFG